MSTLSLVFCLFFLMISKINTFTFIFDDGNDCSFKHLMRNNETLSFPKLLKELHHTKTKHAIMFSENFPQHELHFVPTKSLPYYLIESSFHHSTNQTCNNIELDRHQSHLRKSDKRILVCFKTTQSHNTNS